VGLAWLVTVRWTTVVAGLGATVAAHGAGLLQVPVVTLALALLLWAVSNAWLMWRVRREVAPTAMAGSLVLVDVAVLTGLLHVSGGILNPASVFYLVQIVMAALVLGRFWTWVVTGVAIAGYASLYLIPSEALGAAVSMHHEVALHMRGMWLAFAMTALIIAALVTRLVLALERRDRALDDLRDAAARAARATGLATLAAGAAHELSTPLSTIAIAARELERRLNEARAAGDLSDDARLIRAEADRCRRVLDAMAAEGGGLIGELPRPTTLSAVVALVKDRLAPAERERVDSRLAIDPTVVWPVDVVVRAMVNLVQNGLQASPAGGHVWLAGEDAGDGRVRVLVTDRGAGMSPDTLARAGEPFFTTKPVGQGTGLGLFIARSTIDQLGGRLRIDSMPGRGTTVIVELPADPVRSGVHHDL
jgi:two-component system sensor histidine kinase RegB